MLCLPATGMAEQRATNLATPQPQAASPVLALGVPRAGELQAQNPAAPAPSRGAGDESSASPLAEPEENQRVRFSLAFATHAPLSIGASAGVELAQGLFGEVHLGWMPRAYVDFINGLATDLGLYDPVLGDLIGAALSGSMVVRASVGFRPFGESGLELLAGYSRVTSGGSETSTEIIQRATGSALPAIGEGVPVEATTHALHVAIGVRWILDGGWFLRGRIGYVHTFSASAEVQVAGRPAISEQAEALVDDTLTQYGFTPELQLEAGFRF